MADPIGVGDQQHARAFFDCQHPADGEPAAFERDREGVARNGSRFLRTFLRHAPSLTEQPAHRPAHAGTALLHN
jgi:hypothetical protein